MLDVSDYQPSEEVLRELRKVRLVAVVGPSGSGKTTLVRRALARDAELHAVISDVSRPRRREETDGLDYFFRDKRAMLAAIGRHEYVQVAPSNSGDLYATHIQNYSIKGLALLTIWADAMPVFQKLPFQTMRTIFIVPPSYETWQKRFDQREFDSDLRHKRLAEDRRSLAFGLQTAGVQYVINDDLEAAVNDFIELAHGRLTPDLQKDQTKARAILEAILQRLPA